MFAKLIRWILGTECKLPVIEKVGPAKYDARAEQLKSIRAGDRLRPTLYAMHLGSATTPERHGL